VILVSGALGDHGMAVMSQREGLGFEGTIESDCAPLGDLVEALLAATGSVHALRDPTRGGLATALDEFACRSGVCIEIEEAVVPVHEAVRGACEMLGLDPLYVANEGKMIAVVAPEAAEAGLAALKSHPRGEEAAIIGRVLETPAGRVHLKTPWAGTRILDRYVGEQMPRIC
jgi:hydrogenase expression/formation protein HypE